MPSLRRRALLTLVALLGAAAAGAQPAADDSATILSTSATKAFEQRTRAGVESAIGLWRRALRFAEAARDERTQAAVLNDVAGAYATLGRYDSASVYMARAIPLLRTQLAAGRGDSTTLADALNTAGLLHHFLGRNDSALVALREALPLARGTKNRMFEGVILNSIGLAFLGLDHADSALAYFRLALPVRRETGNRYGEGVTFNNIGLVFRSLGQLDSARVNFERALAIYREVGNRAGDEAIALDNLAIVYLFHGEPDPALRTFAQALAASRVAGNRSVEARILNNSGHVFLTLGRPDSALAHFRQALAIQRQIGERDEMSPVHQSIGIVLGRAGQVDSSLAHFRAALDLARGVGDRVRESAALQGIGSLFLSLDRRDSAAVYFAQALRERVEIGDRRDESVSLGALAVLHSRAGRSDSAVALYRRALALQRATGDRDLERGTLANMASQYRRRGDLRAATAYYDSAAAVTAAVGSLAGDDPFRVSFDEQDTDLYGDWALTWLARAGKTGEVPSGTAALAALAATERGRAQALLDLMRRGASPRAGPAPDAAPDTAPNAAPHGLPSPPAGADLAAEGRALIARATGSGAAVLEYLLTPDTLVVWLARPDGAPVIVRQQVRRDTVARLVGAARRALDGESDAAREVRAPLAEELLGVGVEDEAADTAALRHLARLLLPNEIRRGLPTTGELVVVPHGALWLLSFAALPIAATDAGRPAGVPLGTRLALRYATSLATLAAGADHSPPDAAPAPSRALVVGNPLMPTVSLLGADPAPLPPLPGADREAAWVARRLGVSALGGAEASETAVRRLLPEARLVHLATHGLAYSTEARTRSSFVALAPDSLNDGLLTVAELLDAPELRLRADLVVLSACQTGLGSLTQAEGTLGLQRALLARGARSVLVSLWSVSDAATELLMRRFYTHWLDDAAGSSKAEALRRAQDDVRRTKGYEAPRYWAAFQLVGAP